MKKKLLFVCLGNICRSPAAEGIMRHLLGKNDLSERIEVDSAGIHAYHKGELPDPRMREHASKRGYQLVHRSRPVDVEDFYKFDLIIGMDDQNIADLHEIAPSVEAQKKIHRMVAYLQNREATYVPDPYYGGADGFELVLDLLEDACKGLLLTLTSDASAQDS